MFKYALQMYYKAFEFVKLAHAGQTDKAGKPYIEHLLAVVAGVEDLIDKVIALLHDIVEDTHFTLEDLLCLGFTPEVVQCVDNMTKRQGESYNDYLCRVSSSIRSIRVKLSDLRHNMDIGRLSNPTEKDSKRIARYSSAATFLLENLSRHALNS